MAQTTMKAAICKEPGKPIIVEEVPVPEPTGRQLLVRVKAASLCHSDLSIISGAFGTEMFPLIIGHEAISVVEKLGPEASRYGINVGDVVGVPLWHCSCLECSDCRGAGPQFCLKVQVKGLTCPGYFAEYTLVDPAFAVVVARAGDSAGQPVEQLSPLFCAGVTVWDALERSHLAMGETVAIVGAGGLGQIAARYAQAMGAKVIAIDVRDEQLLACKAEGSADEIVNSRGLEATALAERVAVLNDGKGVDVAIVTSGVTSAYHSAFTIVKPEGSVVTVGLPHEPVPLHISMVTSRCTKIIGAKVPGQTGTQRCLDFTRRKGLYPKIHPRKFKLEDINEMIALMEAGKVEDGRMMVVF